MERRPFQYIASILHLLNSQLFSTNQNYYTAIHHPREEYWFPERVIIPERLKKCLISEEGELASPFEL